MSIAAHSGVACMCCTDDGHGILLGAAGAACSPQRRDWRRAVRRVIVCRLTPVPATITDAQVFDGVLTLTLFTPPSTSRQWGSMPCTVSLCVRLIPSHPVRRSHPHEVIILSGLPAPPNLDCCSHHALPGGGRSDQRLGRSDHGSRPRHPQRRQGGSRCPLACGPPPSVRSVMHARGGVRPTLACLAHHSLRRWTSHLRRASSTRASSTHLQRLQQTGRV